MDIPDACTLPTARRPARLGEFETLFSQAVSSVERISPQHLRLGLSGGPELEASVRDMTARESACCSFFTFTVTATSLDIEVPAAHVDVLDSMQRMAEVSR